MKVDKIELDIPVKQENIINWFLVKNEEGQFLNTDGTFSFYKATGFSQGHEALAQAEAHDAKVVVLEQKVSSMVIDYIDPSIEDSFTTNLMPDEQIENLPENVLKVEYETED